MLELDKLNQFQLEAVSFGLGNLLVLAGPGSGKTFTITQRIFYLIDKLKVSPEKILVITFTKDAAAEMNSRFCSTCKFPLPVNFGTFHSVFYNILLSSPKFKNIKLISNEQKKSFFCRFIFDANKSEINELANIYLSAMSLYKNTGDKEALKELLSREQLEEFGVLFNAYEKYRKNNKLIDYDDVLYDSLSLLKEDEYFKNKWSKRFSHILIDEFQDVNPVQFELIKYLTGRSCNIFAVGDDDQSIYRFRGATPDVLKNFINDFGSKIINLSLNYRNPPDIIKASYAVIEENMDRLPKEAAAIDSGDGIQSLYLNGFVTSKEEQKHILKQLSVNNNKTAILFRTNAEMQTFAVFLKENGIKFIMKEKVSSIYEHFVVKDIMTYLKLAYEPNNISLLTAIINKPERGIDREALLGMYDNFVDNIGYFYNYQKNILEKANILKNNLSYIKERQLKLAVYYVLKCIGYEKYINERFMFDKNKLLECRRIIDFILEDCVRFENVFEYELFQIKYGNELVIQNKAILNRKSYNNGKNNIYLMTVHASKGLEFERVYIPNCNENIFPHGRTPDENTVSEERRLFYVGMTRASKELHLSYIKGTKERPFIVSRFIKPIIELLTKV